MSDRTALPGGTARDVEKSATTLPCGLDDLLRGTARATAAVVEVCSPPLLFEREIVNYLSRSLVYRNISSGRDDAAFYRLKADGTLIFDHEERTSTSC